MEVDKISGQNLLGLNILWQNSCAAPKGVRLSGHYKNTKTVCEAKKWVRMVPQLCFHDRSTHVYEKRIIKVTNFFIGVSDIPKYDIIFTENENLLDRFLPEILTFSVRIMPYMGTSGKPIKNSPFK